jgi:hypothetical protein
VTRSKVEEWQVREERTNRALGRYSTATRPARGDIFELAGQLFEVRQVADLAVSEGETQRGWLIVRQA